MVHKACSFIIPDDYNHTYTWHKSYFERTCIWALCFFAKLMAQNCAPFSNYSEELFASLHKITSVYIYEYTHYLHTSATVA